jgi:hypothetical protein
MVSSDARTHRRRAAGGDHGAQRTYRGHPDFRNDLGIVVAVIHDNMAYPRRCKAGRPRTLALSPRCDDVTAVAVWTFVPPAIGLSSVHRWCPTQHM